MNVGPEGTPTERLLARIEKGDARIAGLVAEVDALHAAMDHRSIIEQAKGVIMSAMGCSADAAFAVLVAQSQDENRKIREIALELAERQDRRPGS